MTSPPLEPARRKLTGAVIPALAAASLAALIALFVVAFSQSGVDETLPPGCLVGEFDHIGGPFSLLDVNGSQVTQADFDDQPAVLYFGFTSCPDACPTALYALGEALSTPGSPDVRSILISIDPERDTPERMRDYVASSGFPAGLEGLTGDPAAIKELAQSFGVMYRRAPSDKEDDENYNVDHTSFIYILDKGWRTRGQMLTSGANPESLSACIVSALR